jgi:type VI protein secretion system component Hcp
VDLTTPKFQAALAANENLKNVTLKFGSPGGTTDTIQLTNANIAAVSQVANSGGGLPQESISFTDQKITWTVESKAGKTTAMDDWEVPAQ